VRVLDLFAGLRGWSDPWKARGHEVITLDYEAHFDSDITVDMREFVKDIDKYLDGWRPDVILASPPCEAFSVMTIGRNWTREHEPKTDKARLALELVGHTTYAIHWLKPKFFIIENPRAKLRRLAPVQRLDRVTVTYCQYGEPFMKPTDLWGGFPPSWWPRPMCKPRADCHVGAARSRHRGWCPARRVRTGLPFLGSLRSTPCPTVGSRRGTTHAFGTWLVPRSRSWRSLNPRPPVSGPL